MYAKRFYGSEFMKNNENKLDDERVTYFSNKKEISYEEYAELMKEIKELTKIISIKKELNNFFRR